MGAGLKLLERSVLACGVVLAVVLPVAIYETMRSTTTRGREFGPDVTSPPWHVGASIGLAVIVGALIVLLTAGIVTAIRFATPKSPGGAR